MTQKLLLRCVPYSSGYWFWAGYWSVIADGCALPDFTWDEMLGAVARFLFCGDTPQYGCKASPVDIDKWVVIERVEGHWWTITKGDRFISFLGAEEALGFIAAYTLNGRELFGGFKTYEQYINRWSSMCSVKPVALIGA